MEKAKAAATLLNESWGGNGGFTSGAAGSYTDGLQKEIENMSTEHRKAIKSSFSVGVLETAMALNNTSFVELAEAKILVDKYINHVSIKGLSEAFLIEAMISELENFAWEKNVKPALTNLKKAFESNRKEIEVAKAIEEINGSGGRDLYSSIVETMRNWLASEERVSEKLLMDLKKWAFNPSVRSLVERVSNLQSQSGNKFNVKVNSSNCDVKSIIAPSLVTENSSVFVTSNRFFRATEAGVRIMEREEAGRLSGRFLKAVLALSNPNVKINESGLDLYIGKNKLSVVFESETESKNIFFNGKRIAEDKLGFTLSFELRNGFQGSAMAIENAVQVVEAANYLSEIDFGKKIVSKIYEGVEANVFKFDNRVFVHRVNPAMKKNELFEGNGSQAVNIVKEFLGFDLSESMTEILDKEDRILSIMKNDKSEIKKNLAIVESEINKINKALEANPALQNSDEIKEAQKMLSVESNSLKEKWNQISVEIERFERGAKKTVVNENEGYGINTDVKINRNGEKGKVVGVNGNSKTYTVMFENGRTGEFFFNDVTDISDEIKNIQLSRVNDIAEDTEETNEGLEADMELAEAPVKTAGGSGKFIQNVKNHNLAKAPGGKSGGSPSDIENLADHELAEAPAKTSSSSKDPKGVSGKHGLAEAPGKKTGSDKKFIQDTKNHNLADAPGGSAKGSSKFVEDLKDHNLAVVESQKNLPLVKAPAGKKEKSKGVVKGKKGQMAVAPGNHKKNGKKDHEPLNRATLAKAPSTKKN
jgi:hypothetical protein